MRRAHCRKTTPRSTRKHEVEYLEPRTLLCSSCGVASGIVVLNLDPTTANSVAVTRILGSIQVVVNGQDYTYAASQVKALEVVGATAADQVTIDPTVTVQAAPQGGATAAPGSGQLNLLLAPHSHGGSTSLHAQAVALGSVSDAATAVGPTDGRGDSAAANTGNEAATVAPAGSPTRQNRAIFELAGFAGNDGNETAVPNAVPVRPLSRTPRAVPAPSTAEDGTGVASAQPVEQTQPDGQASSAPASPGEQAASVAVDHFFEEQLTPAAIESGEGASPQVATPGQPASPSRTGDDVAERGSSSSWRTLGLALAAATALAITRQEIVARRADRRPSPRPN
jgi:hypothetical protein